MKLTIALVTSALFATGVSVKAQSGRSFGDGTLPDFIKPYDITQVGSLTAEEREAARKGLTDRTKDALLAKWDANGDGKLDLAELELARKAALAEITKIRTDRFNAADLDADGFLSLAEFTAALPKDTAVLTIPALFASLDTDKDGKISLAEFLAPCPKPPEPKPLPQPTPFKPMRFADVDTNKDGSISLDELTAYIATLPVPPPPMVALTADQIAAIFAKLDTNNDNAITPDEWPIKDDPNHPPVPPVAQALPAFATADTNKDGFVGPVEFSMAACASHIPALVARDLFLKADVNHDGKLDATEYASIIVPAPPTAH